MILKYAEDWLIRNNLLFKYLYLLVDERGKVCGHVLKVPRKVLCGLRLTEKDILDFFRTHFDYALPEYYMKKLKLEILEK